MKDVMIYQTGQAADGGQLAKRATERRLARAGFAGLQAVIAGAGEKASPIRAPFAM